MMKKGISKGVGCRDFFAGTLNCTSRANFVSYHVLSIMPSIHTYIHTSMYQTSPIRNSSANFAIYVF